jgi:hypothetical protein
MPTRTVADEAAERVYLDKFRVTTDQLQLVVGVIQGRQGMSAQESFGIMRFMLPAEKGISSGQYAALYPLLVPAVAVSALSKLYHALCACVINPGAFCSCRAASATTGVPTHSTAGSDWGRPSGSSAQ